MNLFTYINEVSIQNWDTRLVSGKADISLKDKIKNIFINRNKDVKTFKNLSILQQ
jgi:hypothetical protein